MVQALWSIMCHIICGTARVCTFIWHGLWLLIIRGVKHTAHRLDLALAGLVSSHQATGLLLLSSPVLLLRCSFLWLAPSVTQYRQTGKSPFYPLADGPLPWIKGEGELALPGSLNCRRGKDRHCLGLPPPPIATALCVCVYSYIYV